MPAFEKIVKGALKYKRSGVQDVLREQMRKPDGGQSQSHAVFLTCMDSRLMPTKFTKTHDGSAMFVIRNAGNMVPPATIGGERTIATEPAAIELAVLQCGVHHVVVCGHSDCKAIGSLFQFHNAPAGQQTTTSPWDSCLKHFGAATLEKFRQYQERPEAPLTFIKHMEKQTFSAVIDQKKEWKETDQLSQIHTLQQLENVASQPVLTEVLTSGVLRLHAMWYCVHTGEVFFFKKQDAQFIPLDEHLAERLLAQP